MFKVYESNGVSSKREIVQFDTFLAAFAYIQNQFPISLELDHDNKGCADAYMKDGRILCIEPA